MQHAMSSDIHNSQYTNASPFNSETHVASFPVHQVCNRRKNIQCAYTMVSSLSRLVGGTLTETTTAPRRMLNFMLTTLKGSSQHIVKCLNRCANIFQKIIYT